MPDSPDLTSILKLVSDQTRLRILSVLSGNELTVKELTAVLLLGQSTLSTQLGQLKEAPLLNARKEGQFVYYRLARFDDESFLPALMKQIFSEAERSDWYQRDRRKLQEVLARRREASLAFFNANKTQNQVSPGQTWESMSLGLIQLIRDKEIVDLGCGIGRLSSLLAAAGNRVTGIDNSTEQISIANNLHAKQENLRFACAPMEESGLPSASFDLAILSQALHHTAQPAQALVEAGRLLRKGAQILILDLVRHSQEWIQDRFGDFWLGFDSADLAMWLKDAGIGEIRSLICGPDSDYPGIETIIVSGTKN